jgi:hypothetical protein
MGLIGGNRVSRRQANRWAAQEPQQYAEPAYQQPPPPAAAASAAVDPLEQLQKLGELKAAGVLTEEEFAIQKAKILAQ